MVRWAMLCCALWFLVLPARTRAGEGPGTGLSLAEAVRIAVQASPLSRIAEAGVTAAEEGRLSARGDFLAKLRTQFDFTALDKVPEFSISGSGIPPGLFPPTMPAGETEQVHVLTTLEQPLFTGFGLVSRYRVARLEQEAARIQQEAIRQGVILNTVEAYYGVLLAQRFLEVADRAVRQLESHAEVAKNFYETGVSPKNDYLKVLVQLADIRRKRIVAGHKLDLARSRLRILLRWDEARPLDLVEKLEYRPYERSLQACIREAMQARPEIRIATLDVEKARQAIRGARSRYYPHLSLVGALRHEEGGFLEIGKELSATIHAEWLVWEWGSNYYEVQQHKARLVQAQARRTEKQDVVELEVRKAYLSVEGWKEAIGVARVGLEQAEENYRITNEQYRHGVTTSTELLDAQTALSRAEVNYYEALSDYNVAIARLEKAMGVLGVPGARDAGRAGETG